MADPRFDGINDISQIHEHWLAEIKNFFTTYKMLEDKETQVEGWHGAASAWAVLKRCQIPAAP